MNPKELYGYFECWKVEKPRRTFADMEKEMKKIVTDIHSLEDMNLEHPIKLVAMADLTEQKKKLLAEMHEELNRMYG